MNLNSRGHEIRAFPFRAALSSRAACEISFTALYSRVWSKKIGAKFISRARSRVMHGLTNIAWT